VKRTLRIGRDYPHPPELVWRVLTEPALIAEWLMQNDFAPEVGRRFTLRTDPAPGFDGVVHCQVLELEPPRRMRWGWRGGPIDTVVSFTLSPVGAGAREGTRLEVEQSGFEGLAPVLVSFILGAGNRRIYGRRIPALLDRLAGGAPAALPPHGRGLWWVLGQLFAPILRRARPRPGSPPDRPPPG
jgi:uncharacterized protein YndB with AHSA1/START domain